MGVCLRLSAGGGVIHILPEAGVSDYRTRC